MGTLLAKEPLYGYVLYFEFYFQFHFSFLLLVLHSDLQLDFQKLSRSHPEIELCYVSDRIADNLVTVFLLLNKRLNHVLS